MVSESEFFREMTLRICGSLDIDDALANAFAYLREHMPADSMGFGCSSPTIATMAPLSCSALTRASFSSGVSSAA